MKKKLYVYIDPINIKFPGFSIIANRMVIYRSVINRIGFYQWGLLPG